MHEKLPMFLVVPLLLLALCAVSQAQDAAMTAAFKASYAAEANSDYSGAIKSLTSLGASTSSFYIAQYRLGWLNYCAKDYPQSIACYSKAADLASSATEPRRPGV